jgi:hypothetical protein
MTEVANGHTGHVVAVDPERLTVRLDTTGTDVVLDHRYLQRGGHISHAYALTTHRAQGGTWDLAIAVGADGLYREGAYVQLSRGAIENWLALTAPDAARLHHEATSELERHDRGLIPPDQQPPDVHDDLIDRLTRSRAKQLAHTHDPDLDDIDRLSRTFPLSELDARAVAAEAAERIATDTHGCHRHQLVEAASHIDHVARHLAIGVAVSPADRHNIGTVIAFDDAVGQVTVHFQSMSGREATRTFAWAELRLVHPIGDPRPLPAPAQQHLDTLTARLAERVAAWDTTLEALGVEAGDATHYRAAADQHVERIAYRLVADAPPWLAELLGPRPDDVAGATVWDDTVRDVVRWRAHHHLPERAPGLGDRPDTDAGAWDELYTRVARVRIWLSGTDRIYPTDTITPSHSELLQRRAQLDQLLADAPPDWRATITELHAGQLTLDDTTDTLQAALTGQHERRDWILRHWPHVVEYHEINRTLTTRTWGPDPELLTEPLTRPLTPTLADAIQQREPWLRVALNHLAAADTTQLADTTVDQLEELAAYRVQYDIPADTPLDLTWATPDPTQHSLTETLESAIEIDL